jgi:hypothetical protein
LTWYSLYSKLPLYHLGYKNFSSEKGKIPMRINLEMDAELYQTITSIKQAEKNIGGLSNTSKMPALSTSISIEHCNAGSVLIEIEGSALLKLIIGYLPKSGS